MVPVDADDIHKEYKILVNELEQFNPELLDKPRVLAITKADMIDAELQTEMEQDLPGIPYVFISAVAQQGIQQLKDLIWNQINSPLHE